MGFREKIGLKKPRQSQSSEGSSTFLKDQGQRAESFALLDAVDLPKRVDQLYKYWVYEFLGVTPSTVRFDPSKFLLYDPQPLEAILKHRVDVHIVYPACRLPACFDEQDEAWIAATGSETTTAAKHEDERTYHAEAVIAGPCGFDTRGMSDSVQTRMFEWKVGQLSQDRETPWALSLTEIEPGLEGPSSELEWVLLNQPRPVRRKLDVPPFPASASRSLSRKSLSSNHPPTMSYFRLHGLHLDGQERCVVVSFSLEVSSESLAAEHGKRMAACEPQGRHV